MNRMQFEIGDAQRRIHIINYIATHQGCTKADLERGLKDLISKKTIHKWVSEMINEYILFEKKEKLNSRDHKLFVNENNPLVSAPKEIEQFENAFFSFFNKITNRYENTLLVRAWEDYQDEEGKRSTIHAPKLLSHERLAELTTLRLSIFFRMIDSYLFRSILIWSKQIQDKETRRKLYENVFTKIADMLINITELHDEDPDSSYLSTRMSKSHLEAHISERLGGISSLNTYQERFKKVGMQKEVEAVIDSLWNIDKPIQNLIYREPEAFKFNFNYGFDDWRKLLELYKEYISKKRTH
jgi:hypothetical protein